MTVTNIPSALEIGITQAASNLVSGGILWADSNNIVQTTSSFIWDNNAATLTAVNLTLSGSLTIGDFGQSNYVQFGNRGVLGAAVLTVGDSHIQSSLLLMVVMGNGNAEVPLKVRTTDISEDLMQINYNGALRLENVGGSSNKGTTPIIHFTPTTDTPSTGLIQPPSGWIKVYNTDTASSVYIPTYT